MPAYERDNRRGLPIRLTIPPSRDFSVERLISRFISERGERSDRRLMMAAAFAAAFAGGSFATTTQGFQQRLKKKLFSSSSRGTSWGLPTFIL